MSKQIQLTEPQAAYIVTDAPGQKLLKVVGSLYFLFGSIVIVRSIDAARMLAIMDDWLRFYGGNAMRVAWYFFYLAPLFFIGYSIFIGIMGVANCKNIKMAFCLFILGIVDIVIIVLNQVILISIGVYTYLDWEPTNLLLVPVGFILPILYIIGAGKNMR